MCSWVAASSVSYAAILDLSQNIPFFYFKNLVIRCFVFQSVLDPYTVVVPHYNGLQAKTLYAVLKEKSGPDNVEFTASFGWFK